MNKGFLNSFMLKNIMDKEDKFLEIHNLPKLTHKEIENLKIPMLILKIECAIKTSKMVSLVNSIKLARKKLSQLYTNDFRE